MKLPERAAGLARQWLKALYDDRATVWRIQEDGQEAMACQEISCHLAGKSRLSGSSLPDHRQSWGKATAALSFELFCPPECRLQLGDRVVVRTAGGQVVEGVAGQPRVGKLAACVSLDGRMLA